MATGTQTDLSTGRAIRRSTAAAAAAPTDKVTTPDYVMSPNVAVGLKTTGLLLLLKAPSAGAAVPVAGGFSLILWLQNPVTGSWGAASPITIDFGQWFVTFDFDAAALYFQIDATSVGTPGNVYIEVMEQ